MESDKCFRNARIYIAKIYVMIRPYESSGVMTHNPEKLERADRLEELAAATTLQRFGFNEGAVLCDIGAGSGIFTFVAAGITNKTVYAVEISQNMLELLRSRTKEYASSNVIVEENIAGVPTDSCDMALLSCVLHEVADVPAMLFEINRILKTGGSLVIIEFHKRKTPAGPPVDERLSEEDTAALLEAYPFSLKDRFVMGENYYALRFVKTLAD